MAMNLKSLQKKRQRKEAKRHVKRVALRKVLNRMKGKHRLNERERMIKAIIEKMRREAAAHKSESTAQAVPGQVASSEVEILNDTVPAPEGKAQESS